MHHKTTSGGALLPLGLTAACLLACVLTLDAVITGQAVTGSGQTLVALAGSGATSSGEQSSSVSTSRAPIRFSAIVRPPSSGGAPASTVASAATTSAAASSARPVPEDERELRAMFRRVIARKKEERILEEGLTLLLGSSSSSDSLVIRAPDPDSVGTRGCFSPDGIWTVDGARCAGDQGNAFALLRARPGFEQEAIIAGMPLDVLPVGMTSMAAAPAATETAAMDAVLESWFPRQENDDYTLLLGMLRGKGLRSALELGFRRFQEAAADVRDLSGIAQPIVTAALWTQQTLRFLDTGTVLSQTQLDEIEFELRAKLTAAQDALGNLPSVPPEYIVMQRSIERIMNRTPLVFARLGDAEIAVPEEAAQAYLEVTELANTALDCDPSFPCPELTILVDALRRMSTALDTAIGDSGQFWMYDEADLIYTAE